VLACNADSVDLDAGTWEVNATIVRVKGEGLIRQPRTKTEAGWRVLALPPHAGEMLRRGLDKPKHRYPENVVFGSPSAPSIRDPSNCANDLREIRERDDFDGYEWITFHTFRKTVATRMDEAGLTAREIADQLGHAKPSMTQDVYMGRKVVTARAAEVLGPSSQGVSKTHP
jgi:integrase